MRRSLRIVFVLACVISAVVLNASPGHLPKANTKEAVVAYVNEAAKVVAANGPSCATFATPEWKGGDYYIFVATADGKTVCHPNPKLIGQPTSAIVNASGDKVGEKIMKAGMMSGGGWADYVWNRPGQAKEEPKSTYVVSVKAKDGKQYIVGSGAWNLNK